MSFDDLFLFEFLPRSTNVKVRLEFSRAFSAKAVSGQVLKEAPRHIASHHYALQHPAKE